jgi:ribonuclease E
MGNKMLIDASQPEETRVVVARGSKLEEFDFESASRKPLKGNIYLAKVTRVEPSLQAAFVEYGGNRHGFLAFAEIHPDYYQIPIADRMALLAEQEADEAEDDEDDRDDEQQAGRASAAQGEDASEDDEHDHHDGDNHDRDEHQAEETASHVVPLASEPVPAIASDLVTDEAFDSEDHTQHSHEDHAAPESASTGDVVEVEQDTETQKVETIGEEDAMEEVPQRRERSNRPRRRHYKIQEVIKRRQILLVQVIKEERGNKGAALTTYLSLAGRYCVLMPNTARGGGISRKITDANDRRRLKEVAKDVEVPKGMGVIVRTAGAQRTRPEIKRDFDYLMRLWESVRELTLKSSAPCLVYEEGNLIKRSIRDLYTKDVDEIIVDGEPAYKEAKDFMRMLMPSHAKNVKLYKDPKPLLQRFGVEGHLDALFSPTVNLPSGGYLVINQTEALVSVDINSGKATREHNIEDTATKTNLEACDEIARQLRLRDLAGLVVIDFIDMEENRNNRAVERRMKDALRNDRARIQVGRISHFGLLEMSRQRLRPGLLEGTFKPCPHCEGRGIVRSVPSCGLGVLRQIEEHLQKGRSDNLTVRCAREVAFYLLNEKRDSLLELETQHGISIFLTPGNEDVRGTSATIERAPDREKIQRRISAAPVQMETGFTDEPEVEMDEVADEATDEISADDPAGEEQSAEGRTGETQGERRDGGRRRRRRGRRGGRQDSDDFANGNGGVEARVGEGENEAVGSEAPGEAQGVEGEASPGAEAPTGERNGEDRGEKRGRRRGKFGRGRDRELRGDRPERGERPPSPEPGERHGRPESTERSAVESTPAPQPVVINIPDFVPEPEPRKWQPPAPTVAAEPAARKGGWWKRK